MGGALLGIGAGELDMGLGEGDVEEDVCVVGDVVGVDGLEVDGGLCRGGLRGIEEVIELLTVVDDDPGLTYCGRVGRAIVTGASSSDGGGGVVYGDSSLFLKGKHSSKTTCRDVRTRLVTGS